MPALPCERGSRLSVAAPFGAALPAGGRIGIAKGVHVLTRSRRPRVLLADDYPDLSRPQAGITLPPATWSAALLTAPRCVRRWPHCSRTSSWWISSFRRATVSRFVATSNKSRRKRQSSFSALPLTRKSARKHSAQEHPPLLPRCRQSRTCCRPFIERRQRDLLLVSSSQANRPGSRLHNRQTRTSQSGSGSGPFIGGPSSNVGKSAGARACSRAVGIVKNSRRC